MINIKSLEEAESLITKSKNYFWDGWTIIKFVKDPSAQFHKNGMKKNNFWGYATKYDLTETGWYLPNEAIANR
jgi:hypothetical protein